MKPTQPSPLRRVLIIGVDGCRPDMLTACPDRTPNMLSLSGGKNQVIPNAQTCVVTMSGPGWTSCLTGMWPHKHRVDGKDNDFSNFGSKWTPTVFHR